MRKINVKINDNKSVDLSQDVIGYVEESKATQLTIILNTELQSDEIDYHVVNFRHGENDEKMVSQRIFKLTNGEDEEATDAYRKDDKLILVLPQYVTRYPIVYAQVEGHILGVNSVTFEEEIKTIIKSPMFLMKLDESIVGDSGEFSSRVEGIFAEIYDIESHIEMIRPMIDLIADGLAWEDIIGISKPKLEASNGENSLVIGDTVNSVANGDYSVAIGKNLKAYGDSSVIVGKNGFAIDGVTFAVANGTEENPKLLFEVATVDSTFYVKLYGVTPELTAPNHAIPTIQWVKNYIGADVYPRYDTNISEIMNDIEELKNDLPDGLDQVSKEVLEVRDYLQNQIFTNTPTVSIPLILTQNGWSLNQNGKYTQTVLSPINTNRRNEIDVDIESIEEWSNCFVLATSENENGVVFEADEVPSKNLQFRITSTEVNYAV